MPGVTKEQIRQAREADLFAYLERHERGVLKRDGPNYRHKEHDSLVYVTAKNYWYWNSRGKRINALDYLMEIRGYGLVDAVNALAGPAMQYSFPSRYSQDYAAARQARKPDHCYLPWQKKCATSYVSYLQKRGISTVVIKRCTQLGILYEGSYKKKEPEGKATYIPVCVFVGKDEHGTAKFACMRGIHSDLRKDAYGSDKEGLVIMGCGGDLSEWLDGINDTLAKAEILQSGSRFEEASSFEYKGLTCMLFPFDDVDLNMGKLAMWRLNTHEAYGGTWLSDFVPNYLGGYLEAQAAEPEKPDCPLIGKDGNVFNLVGIAARTLRQSGMPDQAKEMTSRVFSSGSYDEALCIISEYVNITDAESAREPKRSVRDQIKNAKLPEASDKPKHKNQPER